MDDADAPARLPIEDTLDLHAFAPSEVADVVAEYLAAARAAGLRQVRVIHGRGRGVQRATVHAVLARLPWVVAASEAPPDRGGWGATVVVLGAAEGDGTGGPG